MERCTAQLGVIIIRRQVRKADYSNLTLLHSSYENGLWSTSTSARVESCGVSQLRLRRPDLGPSQTELMRQKRIWGSSCADIRRRHKVFCHCQLEQPFILWQKLISLIFGHGMYYTHHKKISEQKHRLVERHQEVLQNKRHQALDQNASLLHQAASNKQRATPEQGLTADTSLDTFRVLWLDPPLTFLLSRGAHPFHTSNTTTLTAHH